MNSNEIRTNYNVQIAVIDSGISPHPKYKGEFVGIHIFFNEEGIITIDNNYVDKLGHGTAINSLIYRIAPDVHLFNIRIYEEEFYADCEELLLAALDYILNYLKCQIVNISSGISSCKNPNKIEKKLKELYEQGVIVVAAYHNVGCMSLPASSKYVIGVDSSSQISNELEYIYIENSLVNVEAKGGLQRLPWINGKYIADAGTSFATAHISGIIAKMIQENPTLNSKNIQEYLKKNAIQIRKNKHSCKPKRNRFKIKKSIIFPYNKEMHSLIRFRDLLPFEITHVYTNKYLLSLADGLGIEDITSIRLDDFDTLILGHISELVKFVGYDQVQKIIEQCICEQKNIYAFDNNMYSYYLKKGGDSKKFFFPSVTKRDIPYETNGKLYNINIPVLGIFGTDANQGKFTLQLELRKRFLEAGYHIGQLGTEPNSLLFGFQYVYPMGFNKGVHIHSYEAIATLNHYIHQIEMLNPDLIIVGCQSGTAPESNYHLDHLNLSQYEFLLGTQPDTVILCISGHQDSNYILKNINLIESATNATVIALVLFPLMRKMETVSNLRRFQQIESSMRKQLCDKFSEEVSLPCYDLSSSEELDYLFEFVIKYYGEEENE